ncbi:MAG: DUF503 domain-containing protein [Anaerolineaceae bacterium]|nr:DUF503 domain-containing protein [Anaerolineaceae bacterium]
MVYSVLLLELRLSGCRSLKEKRSLIKPLLHRLHKEYNVSVAEIGNNAVWNESIIACGLISNEKRVAESCLAGIPVFMGKFFGDIEILSYSIQFI